MDTDHAKRRGSAGLEKFIQKNWKQGKNTCFSSRPLGPYNCLFDNKNTANHNDKKPYSKCNRIALQMFEMKFILHWNIIFIHLTGHKVLLKYIVCSKFLRVFKFCCLRPFGWCPFDNCLKATHFLSTTLVFVRTSDF